MGRKGQKMDRKKKFVRIIVGLIIIIAGIMYLTIGNPRVFINNHKLGAAIKEIQSDSVKINEVIPFKWDAVYTFGPYTSKEDIESVIGFRSPDIKENNISEGMVHLTFVKDKKVVASVLGYDSNLGYRIDFTSKVAYDDNAIFNVTRADGITSLILVQ